MSQLSKVAYWDDVEQEEKNGNLFMSIAEDLYIVGKVLWQCFACGVMIAIFLFD